MPGDIGATHTLLISKYDLVHDEEIGMTHTLLISK